MGNTCIEVVSQSVSLALLSSYIYVFPQPFSAIFHLSTGCPQTGLPLLNTWLPPLTPTYLLSLLICSAVGLHQLSRLHLINTRSCHLLLNRLCCQFPCWFIGFLMTNSVFEDVIFITWTCSLSYLVVPASKLCFNKPQKSSCCLALSAFDANSIFSKHDKWKDY